MNYSFNKTIGIPVGQIELPGELVIPQNASSLAIFSHGSGSSRLSPRNNFVARELHKAGIGTLLFDLLTPVEDEYYSNRFEIDLLTSRLVEATKYIESLKECKGMNVGYFGASTGAASALKAAAERPGMIHAVVSRGGRPDLAGESLKSVKAPTLLIVGQADPEVIKLNKRAFELLRCTKDLVIVKNATHLFEEPGTLEEVARLASEWFTKHLQPLEIRNN